MVKYNTIKEDIIFSNILYHTKMWMSILKLNIFIKRVISLNYRFDSQFKTQRKPENRKTYRNPYISIQPEKLLTIRELAERLRCGRTKAYKLVRTGKIKKVVIQGSIFVRQSDLEAYTYIFG